MKKVTINDNDRAEWVRNHEGLYNWYESWKRTYTGGMRRFVRDHRTEIDRVIREEGKVA